MATERRAHGIQGLLRSLTHALNNLPTLETKTSIAAEIDNLVKFLSSLKEEIDKLPAKEDSEDLRNSLFRLEKLLNSAVENPIWQAVIGSPARPVSRTSKDSAHDVERWKTSLNSLGN